MTAIIYEYATQAQREIVSIIRDDLTQESARGFQLLKTFPNTETLGAIQFFTELAPVDQEALLDSIAYYSLIPFSLELIEEKKSDLLFHKFGYKQPFYGPTFMVGRPQKSTIKKALIDSLTKKGFICKKERSSVFAHGIIGGASATVWMHFNPGAMRQFYFGVSDWMKATIVDQLAPLSVKWNNMLGSELTRESPIISGLSYDQLWNGSPASPCNTGWDLISEDNLAESIETFSLALDRLGVLIARINAISSN